MAYDNTNRGGLWKNKKHTQETHPDYTGKLNVNGTEYWLSAWIKKNKDGEKYMSLQVKPKDENTGNVNDNPVLNSNDDIPF